VAREGEMSAVVRMIIEATAREGADLTENDRAVPGTYVFAFLESEAPELDEQGVADGLDRLEEHALDEFHGKIGIEQVDDIEIAVRRCPTVEDIPFMAEVFESTAACLGYIPGTRRP
jgi:hypothetical protein